MKANELYPDLKSRIVAKEGLFHGFIVAIVVAVAAEYLARQYGSPAMLMALLLGIALNFLSEEESCSAGITFAAKTVLRIGVALLGARISFGLLAEVGASNVILVLAAVVVTILFGLLLARLLGRGWRFGLLTGGSVAICGASAAVAIAAVLPRNENSDRNLLFTILCVTVLSTLAMIAYPVIADFIDLTDTETGVFFGGTIHDVAQVVGAGFTVSQEAGETATLVKLFRVTLLAPLVILISLAQRAGNAEQWGATDERPPLIPHFLLGFLALATLNSFDLLPLLLVELFSDLSRWSLLVAIAAVGMKTSIKPILSVGHQAIGIIVAETALIAIFVLVGQRLMAQ